MEKKKESEETQHDPHTVALVIAHRLINLTILNSYVLTWKKKY